MTKKRALKYGMLLAGGAVCFAFVWENVQATRLGYGIEGLRKEIRELEDCNKYLGKEIHTAVSPQRLQAEAVKIGLLYPEPESLVLLEEKAGPKSSKDWLARLF